MSQTRKVTRQGKGWATRAACRTLATLGHDGQPGSRAVMCGHRVVDKYQNDACQTGGQDDAAPAWRPLAGCWPQGRAGLLWARRTWLAGGSLPHSLRATV